MLNQTLTAATVADIEDFLRSCDLSHAAIAFFTDTDKATVDRIAKELVARDRYEAVMENLPQPGTARDAVGKALGISGRRKYRKPFVPSPEFIAWACDWLQPLKQEKRQPYEFPRSSMIV